MPSDYMVVARFVVPYPQRPFKLGNFLCNTEDFGPETTPQLTQALFNTWILMLRTPYQHCSRQAKKYYRKKFSENITFTIFPPTTENSACSYLLGKATVVYL